MNSLNRNEQPGFNPIDKIKYINAEKTFLSNNIPLYKIYSGINDVLKIDFIFPAGIWYQPQPLISSFTNAMILEGTSVLSSREISERLDFLGSYIYPYYEKDVAGLTVYCLNKYLEETLKILQEILSGPSFPQSELDIHIENKRQKFQIESGKVKIQSLKLFNEMLFGKYHPYGRITLPEDFNLVTGNLISEFYNKQYNLKKCLIIASGKVDDVSIRIIDRYIGSFNGGDDVIEFNPDYEIQTSSEKITRFSRNDSVQNSIRVGKLMFNKLHADYTGIQLLNLVFGGYFGSRLMKNIREDKGYTYGIHSSVISMQKAGVFMISTEAGYEFTDKILFEIKNEISELQSKLIPEDELLRVKNYFMGMIVRGFDGAFEMADSFKSILLYGLDYNYFDEFIENVNSISSAEINELAKKYFDYESLKITIAGREEE